MTQATITTALGSLTIEPSGDKAAPVRLTGRRGIFSHTMNLTAEQARAICVALIAAAELERWPPAPCAECNKRSKAPAFCERCHWERG